MKGTASNCDEYHKVVSGDGCYKIAQEYGLTLDKVSFRYLLSGYGAFGSYSLLVLHLEP
jgi:hypothetical protein